MALVEVHGRHRACVACIENLSALKDTFKKTEEKFHSLGKLADTMTKDLWTSMTILVDENIINSLKVRECLPGMGWVGGQTGGMYKCWEGGRGAVGAQSCVRRPPAQPIAHAGAGPGQPLE